MKSYLLIGWSFWLVAMFFVAPVRAQTVTADSFALKHQNWATDSLETLLKNSSEDTTKAIMLYELSWQYAFNQPEKGLLRSRQSLKLSQKLGFKKGIASAYGNAAWCYWALGNYNQSLVFALMSLRLFEELSDQERIAWTYVTLANIYRDFGDYPKAMQAAHKAIHLYEAIHISARVPIAIAGSIYSLQNRLDSAQAYVQKAHELDLKYNKGSWGWIDFLLGNIQEKLKHPSRALAYYRISLPFAIKADSKKDIIDNYNSIANIYDETGQSDSCIYSAKEVLQNWKEASYQKGVLEAVTILANVYKEKGQPDSAIKYLELSVALSNKLFNQKNERDIQSLALNEQMRQDDIERDKIEYSGKLKMYALLSGLLLFLGIALALYSNNKHRQKAYALLQQQKAITDRTLEYLKKAQAQLIQSEKMASMGELTAGIAHEIQNPLNFVNNFSEVSIELLDEMEEELEKGDVKEASAIATDIKQNLEKINQHGKRADFIVKGMLQHSRTSTGELQLTNINVLAKEFLKLSYHGLRAKDKSFNAELTTNFDENLPKINIVQQDIGRVLLNLFNNAFYAVQQKQKTAGTDYKPEVIVSTSFTGTFLTIKVKDNGAGIPENIKEKIMQPFFTTKPTGEGTGLGLSLSYDIVVKGHGGKIEIESEEGKGSEFIVNLPVASSAMD